MSLTSEPFSYERANDVRDFVVRTWSHLGTRAVLHYGDFYHLTPRGRPVFDAERDMRLFRDEGDIVGLAWFDNVASGEVAAAEFTRALFGSMLDWLESEHKGSEWGAEHRHFSVQAWDDDDQLATLLAARGYEPGELVGHRLLRSPIAAEPGPLPAGYRFDGPEPNDAFSAKLDYVIGAAFDHPQPYRRDLWRSYREMGGYRDDLAVLLVDILGEPVAAALCWYDEANHCGEFEPVGVLPGRHGAGLGHHIMAEGLRRLEAKGATTAIVGVEAGNAPAIGLYRSAGFEITGTRRAYRRDLS